MPRAGKTPPVRKPLDVKGVLGVAVAVLVGASVLAQQNADGDAGDRVDQIMCQQYGEC